MCPDWERIYSLLVCRTALQPAVTGQSWSVLWLWCGAVLFLALVFTMFAIVFLLNVNSC